MPNISIKIHDVDWSTIAVICDDCMRRVDRVSALPIDWPTGVLEINCHGETFIRTPGQMNLVVDSVKRTVLLSHLGESNDDKMHEDYLRLSFGKSIQILGAAARSLKILPGNLANRDIALIYAAMVDQGVSTGTISPESLESASVRLMELFQLVQETQLSRKDPVDQPG